jgi:glyoxylase-like metal-dependent hydrolase (beta-lactamase superfamily II)
VLVKQIPGLKILAEEQVAHFLAEKKDPLRPVPTETFKDHRTLKLGTATIELTKGRWHSDEGDLFIYFPGKKALMAVDTIAPGWVPFQDFDLTANMYAYLGMFDQLLAYDWDVLIPGHLTSLGTREDVQTTKEYTTDIYKTVRRVHDNTDQAKIVQEAAAKYTYLNKFALFRTVLDGIVEECTKEVEPRWIDKLGAVDVYTPSHCRAMLTYVRWED